MSVLEASGGVQFAKVDANASGDNQIVAAVVDRKIRVVSLLLVAGTPVEHSAAWGCFETSVNEALIINLDAVEQLSGWITYQEIL